MRSVAADLKNRNDMFQHLVLQLLWLIVLYVAGKRPTNQLLTARSNCIAFGDLYGNQSYDANRIRRDITYWWMD